MNSLPCNVVLLPLKELAPWAIELSMPLKKYDCFLNLEVGKYFPHLTLYMFTFIDTDLPKVEDVLSDTKKSLCVISASAVAFLKRVVI